MLCQTDMFGWLCRILPTSGMVIRFSSEPSHQWSYQRERVLVCLLEDSSFLWGSASGCGVGILVSFAVQ